LKLLINFISKLGVDSVSRLVGFVTLPVITRYLGPEGYGLFSYLFVIVTYFGFFIDFGYLNYGTNKLCENIDSSIVIGKIISLQLMTAILSLIILIIAGYFFFESEKYVLLLVFSVTFITQIFAIKYYYLANNKLYFNSLSELAGQLIYACLVFTVFIKFPSVLTLIILSVIQLITTSAFLFIPFIRKKNIRINFNIKSNIATLREAYKLGLSYKAEGLASSFVLLCLGIFLSDESVGLYNASFKIYLILLAVIQGMTFTLMPVILTSIKNKDERKSNRISLIFFVYFISGACLFLFTFFFAEKIILILFGIKFVNAIPLLRNISFTILIWPVAMFIGLIILAYNKYNYLLMISVLSFVFSVIFSLILINFFGIYGGALVLAFVGIETIIVSLICLKKIIKKESLKLPDFFSIRNAFDELKYIINKRKIHT
jgi:polysaccharide transporter, PST family